MRKTITKYNHFNKGDATITIFHFSIACMDPEIQF